MGTIVNVPAHYDLSHKLSNFSDFDFKPYENFIENRLQFTNPFNPVDTVVAEEPYTEPVAPAAPIVPETTTVAPDIGNDLNSTTIEDTLLGETNKDISGKLSDPVRMPPQAPRIPSNIPKSRNTLKSLHPH